MCFSMENRADHETATTKEEMCGVELPTEFVQELNLLIREHLSIYRMEADRRSELMSVANLRCVPNTAPFFERDIIPMLDIQSDTRNPRSQHHTQDTTATTAEPSPRYDEVRSLRRRGLVSAISSGFRSQLENIVGSFGPRTQTTNQVHGLRSVAATSTSIAPPPPPPPPFAQTAGAGAVRDPDEAYLDRLIEEMPLDPDAELVSVMNFRVTSRILASNFRDELEHLVSERLQTIPPENRDVYRSTPTQRSSRPNPQPQHRTRPLFVEPGAYPGSPSAVTMQNELAHLRTEVEELRRLMMTSLQAQTEMQRMLSQQVSAVFSGLTSNSEQGLLPAPQVHPHAQPGRCVVCADADADIVFLHCGHVCSCIACAHECKAQRQACPICRAPINNFVRCFPV